MRDLIDRSIGVPPPSTVDVDAVVAAGRRRVRRGRLATIGVLGSAAAGTAAVVTVIALGLGPGTPTAPSGPVQPATTPSGGAVPIREGETPEQASQRIAAALSDALAAALPGVGVTDWSSDQPGVVVSYDGSRYTTTLILTAAAGQNQIDFESWPGGHLPPLATVTDWPTDSPSPPPVIGERWFESCADAATDQTVSHLECAESTGPHGQTIVVLTARCRAPAPDQGPVPPGIACPVGTLLGHRVRVTWSNAKVDLAIAHGTSNGGPSTPPLLTAEQLIAIAADPDLAVAA